ncbi:CDT1-like protein a, chloroplastic [Ipomoea triloba]|uniref:CDT1-like protein a, chloroplastic n=1 Tax=Ipomoea triloba TaxID=35885 RepID=UPI00125DF4F7|nr:CDT1-like protein a, chloroplastic [Ipomoea triloba]XP_031113574.1 CDT1-like protein a, chloroplastic [Ipomoea triloba]
MDSTDSSLLDSSKTKKVLHSSSKPNPSPEIKSPDRDPWSSKTPEKPVNAPRRSRNRSSALSLKQVRQAALKLRKSDPLLSSAAGQIGSQLESPPPAKPKKSDGPAKLPEKYEILGEFFNSLDNSIRLLLIKGSKTTFTNISTKIECLTDRRFSHSHLAQLKFILPEAIEVTKILVHDERTSCMKPDLRITLNASAVGDNGKVKSGSGNLELRKVFRARLLDFFKSHPEGDDIPEEELPHPFNQSKPPLPFGSSLKGGEARNEAVYEIDGIVVNLSKPPASTSHLSRSFGRSFSQRSTLCRAEDTKQERTVAVNLSPERKACKSCADSGVGCSPNAAAVSAKGTPTKLASTPVKPMSSTPALRPPKRCYMTPEDNDSAKSPNKLVRRPSRGRLIFDTPVKNAGSETERLSAHDDIYDLPEDLLQSIREKERKALEEKDPAISQAKWRKQMLAGLPKLFDMIYFLFQSIRRSVITKEELMYKIISSHLGTVDTREIEEQLRLLHELAPEWIYEKPASSGDLLICVNKIPGPESIRSRLADAK